MSSIRYLGSKSRISQQIVDKFPENYETFYDLFCGTGTISSLVANGERKIVCNDILKSSSIITEVQLLSHSDVPFHNLNGYNEAIRYLNKIQSIKGFIFNEYSPEGINSSKIKRKYFMPENAKRIDAIRTQIENWKNTKIITDVEYRLLIGDLLESANKVANTSGTYGCFLKQWTPSSLKELNLVSRELRNKTNDYSIFNKNIFDLSLQLNDNSIVYLDPPYTKRQYPAYYHISETIVEWDNPKVSGVTGLRNWKDKASAFSYKSRALDALNRTMMKFDGNHIFLSYSSEGHVEYDILIENLNINYNVRVHQLGKIGRYRPNKKAANKSSFVDEYLIEITNKS